MKNLLLTLLILVMAAHYAVAQSAYGNRFSGDGSFSNWFIGAGAGPQVFFGDHDKKLDFGKRITAGYEFYVGNWFTPDIGARIGFNGYKINGLTQNGAHSTGEAYDAANELSRQKINYFYAHADVMFNIMNYFYSYDVDRIYSFIPYVGVGLMSAVQEPTSNKISFNLGFFNSFKLTRKLDFTIDIRGNIVGDGFDGELGGRKSEGLLVTAAGLKYAF
ncbi:hypothetical protein [Sphingobacterium hungaricum]|uniref:Outer membrane protein beta-barrel domain-containing protein n=1 Tax=Sphingobacterium hungaricum TaxID=2082723 RepID=A0A928UTC8_9SPHI|nr:hypothetical protein [Sphingobacterium hungaricum]MBE8712372.1 hypothetical protein [Sphingobacterium hungaricum]